jgi:hypothetical protein
MSCVLPTHTSPSVCPALIIQKVSLILF